MHAHRPRILAATNARKRSSKTIDGRRSSSTATRTSPARFSAAQNSRSFGRSAAPPSTTPPLGVVAEGLMEHRRLTDGAIDEIRHPAIDVLERGNVCLHGSRRLV